MMNLLIISSHPQLSTNIWYTDAGTVMTNFFFCKELPEQASGDKIFRVTDKYQQKWIAMKGPYYKCLTDE
jgi:hypothetical protein